MLSPELIGGLRSPVTPTRPSRRQSCDRCHEQKVRCTRAPNVDENSPCIRCQKTGSECVHSAPQKSGRPPLHKDGPRRRSRKSVTSMSVSSTATSTMQPLDSLASSNLKDSSPDMCFDMSMMDPLTAYDSVDPTVNMNNFMAFGDWFNNNGMNMFSFPSHMDNTPPSTEQVPLSPRATPFPPNGPFTSATTKPELLFKQDIWDHELVSPPTMLSPDSMSESLMQQLAELNVLIGQTAQTVLASGHSSLSLSSPAFNKILDQASVLLSFITRLNKGQQTTTTLVTSDPMAMSLDFLDPSLEDAFSINGGTLSHLRRQSSASTTTTSTPSSYADPGVVLMVLSCYQRLLGGFENVYALMHQQVATTQHQHQHKQRTRAASQQHSPGIGIIQSSTGQLIMMIELMSHLLRRLDHTLAPLTGITTPSDSDSSSGSLTPPSGDETWVAASSGSLPTMSTTPATTDFSGMMNNNGQMAAAIGATNHYGGSPSNLAEAMHERQSKVKAQLRALKRLVQSRDLY